MKCYSNETDKMHKTAEGVPLGAKLLDEDNGCVNGCGAGISFYRQTGEYTRIRKVY
ncbi:MAG: hypothetical protein LBL09_04060 [Oscillospiraceae bacterium]|jgi:hypothetical protein|nr:hypothetical protein [Oscillospiraceae bacterium]